MPVALEETGQGFPGDVRLYFNVKKSSIILCLVALPSYSDVTEIIWHVIVQNFKVKPTSF